MGRVFVVERPAPLPWTVYKWVGDAELRLIRDRLPGSLVPAPRLARWWPAEAGLPAAVELEHIPHLAAERPRYHFAPEAVGLSPGDWLDGGLDRLIKRLAEIHKAYRGADDGLRPSTPTEDLADFDGGLGKLKTVEGLPGGERWQTFWADRREMAERAFAAAHAPPATWLWVDAKWDHVGRRADGSLAILEWGDRRGPGGSDLFLLLFLDRSRRERLIAQYARTSGVGEIEVRSALLRSCFIHGPGLACLSVRGVAQGESSDADRQAWSREAETVARAVEELSH